MGNAAMVRMLLDAGADPAKRTLPDKTFPEGVTPISITRSESVKRILESCGGEAEKGGQRGALRVAT